VGVAEATKVSEMFVHRSNSLEELVDHLSGVLEQPLPTALEQEVVLIQSAGMERYLSRELSRRSGILANTNFPFPRSFLRQVLDASLGEEPLSQRFERETMAWALFSRLNDSETLERPEFSAIQRYLSDDIDSTKRLLLSERLANLFDQYVTYRPRMVGNWENGAESDEVQAILWRDLVEQFGSVHFAARCQRFIDEVDDETLRAALPSRVSLMGGPGLPPLFLQMLARIGRLIPVHVYSFTVCQEYFADAHPLDGDLSELGEGLHPLLVSLGKVGGDYQHLLEMIGEYEDGSATFRVPKVNSVLTLLQRDLVQGRIADEPGDESRGAVLASLASDRSIAVHSTHSRLREVEILHDRLLSWFKEDPSLRPEDVVVLAPNIEEYSPLIQAVFSARARAASEKQEVHVPFRIADRSEKYTNAAARAMLLGLGLFRGRFKASELLDLLQLPPVRARYEIDSSVLERMGRWVADSGIRWGVDGAHRREFSLPDDDTSTWRFGLRRLVLGYALADDDEQIWQGTVPFDDVAAGDAESLGRLCDFCESLFSIRERIARSGEAGVPLAEWPLLLNALAEGLLGEDKDGAWDVQAVTTALFDMKERYESLSGGQSRGENADLRLGLPAMIHLLEQELDGSRPSTDFLAGGVTFCALLPLRTIPFRGVCVLGLGQGEFPRMDSHHQLDLIARTPRRGDRSLRADDRYLFLEVLLAARERLSLSYVGRSVQDNTEKPPSVILSELSSVLQQVLGEAGKSVLEPHNHPLQPFNESYFDEAYPELVSFDKNAFLGASALADERNDVSPFYRLKGAEALASDEAEGAEGVEISLSDLSRFWKDPAAAYLRSRGVVIDDEIEEVEDREPILESPLARFMIGDRALSVLSSGKELRRDIALRRGDLPVGRGGHALLDKVEGVAKDIWQSSQPHREQERREPLPVDLRFEVTRGAKWKQFVGEDFWPTVSRANDFPKQIRLTGSVDRLYGPTHLEMSYGQQTVGRLILLWIEHLAGCAASEESSAPPLEKSILVTRGNAQDGEKHEELILRALEPQAAKVQLEALCTLAAVGKVVPIRFFAGASQKYIAVLHKPKRGVAEEDQVAAAVQSARDALFPKRSYARTTPSVTEVFRGEDPLGTQSMHPDDLSESPFALLAEKVFGPLLSCIEEAAS